MGNVKKNSKEEKAKKTDECEMGQAHDQPGRERPERRNTWKQSNGPGPITIEVRGVGFAPIRLEYRSSRQQVYVLRGARLATHDRSANGLAH
jgi:hypothetical protein